MAVDFWADKYWNGQYFNVRYFGQGEEAPGAMSASISGSGTVAATLTATGSAVANPKQRGGGAVFVPIFQFPLSLPAGFMSARIRGSGTLSGELTTRVKGRPKMPAAVHNKQFWALADL
jgi:hypothetical protein